MTGVQTCALPISTALTSLPPPIPRPAPAPLAETALPEEPAADAAAPYRQAQPAPSPQDATPSVRMIAPEPSTAERPTASPVPPRLTRPEANAPSGPAAPPSRSDTTPASPSPPVTAPPPQSPIQTLIIPSAAVAPTTSASQPTERTRAGPSSLIAEPIVLARTIDPELLAPSTNSAPTPERRPQSHAPQAEPQPPAPFARPSPDPRPYAPPNPTSSRQGTTLPQTAPTTAPLPSVAPQATQPSNGPTGGDVFLDGTRVGHWLADHLAREASRPPAGATPFDPKMTAAWPNQ